MTENLERAKETERRTSSLRKGSFSNTSGPERLSCVRTEDAQLATEFGYKAVFERRYGMFSSLSFAFSVGGLFTALMTTWTFPLQAGGPACIVWCWFIAGGSSLALTASVCELISAYPTSAGAYYALSRLAPAGYVPILSWITGWLNLLGQVSAVAATEYGAAQLLLSAVAVGSDFAYIPSVKQTIGVAAGMTVFTGAINSLSTKWMEKLTKTFVVFHITVVLVFFITILAVEKNKNSASYVFASVMSNNGWNPPGFAFQFGLLSAGFTMTNYDATAHICEEIKRPNIIAPWAAWWANFLTWILGLMINIALVFCMRDPKSLLANQIGQPVVQIMFDSLGKAGALAFTACGVVIIQFTCTVCMQSLSRTIFAYSRDGMLPLSRVWTRINSKTTTPLFAVWVSVLAPILITQIGLGSYAAVSAIFNTSTAALDCGYAIPIATKLIFRRFKPGPFSLGMFSSVINLYSVIWTMYITVLFLFPTVRPVTLINMNYAVVIFAFIFVFATIYWYAVGKKNYTGPVEETIIGVPPVQEAMVKDFGSREEIFEEC